MDRHPAFAGRLEHTEFSRVSLMVDSGGGQRSRTERSPPLPPRMLGVRIRLNPHWRGLRTGVLRNHHWMREQDILLGVLPQHTPSPRRDQNACQAAQQTCCPVADYKCFNSSNVSIRPWSWNYRSCWHQTCPPVANHHCVWIASIPSSSDRSILGVAAVRCCLAELCLHWAICAPAARLGGGSHLSGSLSRIEPWFSVTR